MQALRDAMSQITAHNAAAFGISTDSVESHKKFHEQQKLNFPLLADADKKVSEAYGVLMPNGMASRVTFIIGPDGRIRHIDRNVNGQFNRTPDGLTSRHGDNLALLLGDWKAEIGKPVPVFSLPAADGNTAAWNAPGKRAAVIAFVNAQCPASAAYDRRLVELASNAAYKDVAFMAVDPTPGAKLAALKADAQNAGYPFPLAQDAGAAIAARLDARATPSVYVLDSKGVLVYSGAIDDSADPAGVRTSYLRDALDSALAGKSVAIAHTKASGCPIRRARRSR